MKDIELQASETCRLQQSHDSPLHMYTCNIHGSHSPHRYGYKCFILHWALIILRTQNPASWRLAGRSDWLLGFPTWGELRPSHRTAALKAADIFLLGWPAEPHKHQSDHISATQYSSQQLCGRQLTWSRGLATCGCLKESSSAQNKPSRLSIASETCERKTRRITTSTPQDPKKLQRIRKYSISPAAGTGWSWCGPSYTSAVNEKQSWGYVPFLPCQLHNIFYLFIF